jgi:hypothetical protein
MPTARCSLAGILANPRVWWTPTATARAKAKALARIARDRELLRGVVKVGNVLCHANPRIQIADFSPIRLGTVEVKLFLGGKWAPAVDVCKFAPRSSEIAVWRPATPGTAAPALGWPMIADQRCPNPIADDHSSIS